MLHQAPLSDAEPNGKWLIEIERADQCQGRRCALAGAREPVSRASKCGMRYPANRTVTDVKPLRGGQ